MVCFRLVELKEKMNSKENEAINTIKELSERLKAVTTDLGIEKEKRYKKRTILIMKNAVIITRRWFFKSKRIKQFDI